MAIILLITSAVLLLTCSTYFAYEYFTFRHTTVRHLSTLGKILASNTTAALAFDNREDANEILSAVKADPHIVAVGLYDEDGNLFSRYPQQLPPDAFPAVGEQPGYYFEQSHLIGFEPVVQGDRRLGTLYLKSDMDAMYERLLLYSIIAILVITVSLLLAYQLSKVLQKQISFPIIGLAVTAKAISDHQDYSVRAAKLGHDEIGLLTDAFNQMLDRIQEQTREITSFNQKLEQNVRERTQELQIANKEMEAFSYSVSHDLRAPLRAIHGYSQMLFEDYESKLDSEGVRLLNAIKFNAKRMGRLVDDLLSFSRMGKRALNETLTDIDRLVDSIINELSPEEKGHTKITVYPLSAARADHTLLRQAFQNLISNAIKYSSKKENPAVEIGFKEIDGEPTYFVKDNGAGFDMTYYNKLFGVFQRLHEQEEFEGTGVGLAIVQRIIHRHGGKIWAEAKVGEGATFYFTLQN